MKKHLVNTHFILQIAFLVYIGYVVHWSVAVMLAWLSVSLYSINERNIRHMNAMKENYEFQIEKARVDILGKIQQAAQNTVVKVVSEVHQQRISPLQPKKPHFNPEQPRCTDCMENPAPGAIIYNEGNCPIHD